MAPSPPRYAPAGRIFLYYQDKFLLLTWIMCVQQSLNNTIHSTTVSWFQLWIGLRLVYSWLWHIDRDKQTDKETDRLLRQIDRQKICTVIDNKFYCCCFLSVATRVAGSELTLSTTKLFRLLLLALRLALSIYLSIYLSISINLSIYLAVNI